MIRRTAPAIPLLLLGLAIPPAGCRPERPVERAEIDPADPRSVAAGLLQTAGSEPLEDATLERLFGAAAVERPAELLDALDALAAHASARIVELHETGPDALQIDLEDTLPGGGSARLTVQLGRRDSAWEVTWFQAPGVEWPPPGPERGERLSTSAHPRDQRQ